MTTTVSAVNLVKRYPSMDTNAVHDVTFSIESNECVGLLGPNGAGKTTLLKLICGVTRPSTGTITVHGVAPTEQSGKRELAVVHQSTPFDMMLSVWDNLRIAAGFRGLRWRTARHRAAELLDTFDLGDKRNQLVFSLSGGQMRRLQVVRAMLRVPRLLLLDEPSAGMDIEGRRRVWGLLADLRIRYGTTILWTSHYLEELERNCERVMVLRTGALIRDASPAEIIDQFGQAVAELGIAVPSDLPRVNAAVERHGLSATDNGTSLTVHGAEVRLRIPGLLADLNTDGVTVRTVEFRMSSLEDAFIALTQQPSGVT